MAWLLALMPALMGAQLAGRLRVRARSPVRGWGRLECQRLAESVARHLEQVFCRGPVLEHLVWGLVVSVGRHQVLELCQELGRGVQGQAAEPCRFPVSLDGDSMAPTKGCSFGHPWQLSGLQAVDVWPTESCSACSGQSAPVRLILLPIDGLTRQVRPSFIYSASNMLG